MWLGRLYLSAAGSRTAGLDEADCLWGWAELGFVE